MSHWKKAKKEVSVLARPIPYKGNEPYIFISYAHKDGDTVLPIVQQMQQDGFRVWYDEGIDPGTEWDENIATHLSGCACMIAVLSKNYMASENCKDELYYARELHKPIIRLYREKVTMPRGLELRVGRSLSYRADRAGRFISKLYQAEALACCCKEIPKPKKVRPYWLIGIALAIVVAIVGVFLLAGRESTPTPPPVTDADSAQQSKVLLDRDGFRVTALGVEVSDTGDMILKTQVENSTRTSDRLFLGELQINGVASGIRYYESSAGESTQVDFTWEADYLSRAGLPELESAEDIKAIEGAVYFADYQNREIFLYTPNGTEHSDFPAFVPEADDVQLLDNENGLYLYLTDQFYDDEDRWVAEFLVQNSNSYSLMAEVNLRQINAYQVNHGDAVFLRPSSWAKLRIIVDDWQDTDQNSVLTFGGELIRPFVGDGESSSFTYSLDDHTVLEPRQLKPEDTVLLENEYLQMAAVGAFSNMDYCACRIYCRNLSQEPLFVHFGYVNEEDGIYHLVGSCTLPVGGQYIVTDSYSLSFVEKPEIITFEVECEDTYMNELFIQEVSFAPDW